MASTLRQRFLASSSIQQNRINRAALTVMPARVDLRMAFCVALMRVTLGTINMVGFSR